MRTDLAKLVTVTRVLEEAGGELAATRGGDKEMAHAEALLWASRNFRRRRIKIAVIPGTRRPRS